MADSNRIEKINSLIQRIVGGIILLYTKGSNGLVTVSKVQTSRDLRWAKIWITIVNADDNSIIGLLNNNIYDIQGELNRQMEVKIVPRISFHLDTTTRYAEHISKIFQQIEEEKKHDTKNDQE